MSIRQTMLLVALAIAARPAAAGALPPGPDASPVAAGGDQITLDSIEIISQQLDAARLQIQPSLGASAYSFNQQALQAIPQGENAPLNQVLLQAPGVAQDSFGQVHVRGDHANVQYRINGVQLPEGLSVFGQALETRFARSISLITGALPAQYGFQTAGVLDIQTKTGLTNPGLGLTAYGGTFAWAQPSFEYGGRYDKVDWFITGDYLQNARGIENPAPSFNALHDNTEQWHGFSIMNAIIDPDTRVSVFGGAFNGQFQIPNNPGQAPQLGLTVKGASTFNSGVLNENQSENTQFGVISLQKHIGSADVQISAFVRNSNLSYAPDPLGDLLFNGIAQSAQRSNLAGGMQADGSWRLNDSHTLRAGFLAQLEHTSYNTFSNVLPVDSTGAQTLDQPIGVVDIGGKTGGLYGVYLQDEWRILPVLTLNYGLRFDGVNEYTNETQVSPRINAVWKATETTTIHAGYSRYFVPPPFELVAPTSIGLFANTTAAPSVTRDDSVKAERSHYFDLGVTQLVVPGFTVGVDGYYKLATNLIDEGQFGAPIILSAFNYASARVGGVEFTASYDVGPWSIYGNAAYSRAMGINIISSQFNFAPDELAYIQQNYIHLDHDQTWTASAGAAYTFNQGTKFATRVSVDLVAQSGLRASTATVPNGASLPEYAAVNASIVQKLDLGFGAGTELRLDVLNLNDAQYQIRDGSGVGVGAPQFGLRRTLLAGVTQRF
ncbi:Outer membrane receptor proteins, mostly Fe transport [Methylocella tundrae]|uniref:Outer membrane receptor proteins, mostly Fe transport n=2 Tax=Methylocella tundrae TaxID=227605 RepID=A0A8B6M9Y1_METTU|nr:Outer membrane receptor proteins, mostly Fe transport [Methylocella tundrae]VTZ51734.1 Outer membrane receptor proteins, mostly Fe transport [Methylocella tundrae]